MKRNSIQNSIGVAAISLGLLSLPQAASAIPILQVNGGGKLTGALDVDVGGLLYAVEFISGSCSSVFGTCTAANFDFTTSASALAASQALLNQVLLDVDATHLFDSVSTNTLGCNATTW